ncbi:hypothetical protein [Paenibacillus pinihumi]|uniref:hypothetical protein n=1 Tax=Paenibacillus pinihumi TaxID=669462 RepID=UPI0003FEF938|nr:hypothetical protein [Paenibacillus pinihumi]
MAIILIIVLTGWGLYVMLNHPQDEPSSYMDSTPEKISQEDRDTLVRISNY